MVGVYLFVEGGGDSSDLKTECRRGFSMFLEKAGLKDKMPRIVACGGREQAFDKFSTAKKNNKAALLLVDSESPVGIENQDGKMENWKPWTHLENRLGDNWGKPDNATDTDCHLMVQCMESWFIADRETLKKFFGQRFNEKLLPAGNAVETIEKVQVYQSLANW